MANNYLQFSFAIRLETDEEKEWARQALAYLDERREQDDWQEWDWEGGTETADELASILPQDDCIGFDAQVDDDGLWIYTEESGSPEHVVPLVQAYLRQFHPDGHVGFTWATTCSKPRVDEFSGGAVFITAVDAQWMEAGSWLEGMIKHYGKGEA